ncbi:uncharacterized protein [Henckelia pumila]|uniref:uncharacterized protein n=1 Tax=Henckelia pumila TaxID=405737 RepID=UPI003C6DDD10
MDATATPMETLLKIFQSFRPLTLKGTKNPVDCESWLEDIDQLFDSLDYNDDRRIRLVIHQLQGIAKSWWNTTKKALENRGTVISWSLFKTEFYKRFFPVSYRKDKGAEFANLRQGNMNIEEYVTKFDNLLWFAPHVADSEKAKADHFINGLNPYIFTLVNTGGPNNFADAMDQAKGAEAGLMKQRGYQCASQQPRQFQGQSSQFQNPQPQYQNSAPRYDEGNSGNTGASHTFISEKFVLMHSLSFESLTAVVSVSSPLGRGIISVRMVRGCEFRFEDNTLELDCIVLGLSDFDCIVGIDALTKYRATVDYFQKVVRFRPEMVDEWKFFGTEGFLIFAVDLRKSSPELVDIPVVREFPDDFPEDVPGFPPMREVEFTIELTPGTQPISKAPYRMAPIELKELKDQLEDLIAKGYIRPSVFPFMGLAGYYRRLIEGFSSIAKPITQLTQKNAPFIWNEACEASFVELKKRLTSAPVLDIPSGSGIHDVFHVSMLRKYQPDPSRILQHDEAELDETLSYFERQIQILDRKEKQLRPKLIQLVKVQWSRHGV